jgi:PIN domain nuclease of toxin-antitoxin system
VRLLLDTHALIWWVEGRQMTADAEFAIRSADNDAFVSAVSVWEAETKIAIGKLKVHFDPATGPVEHGFEPLPITFAHAAAAGRLPLHHRDPWDRMLVAQAQIEGLTIVSRDPVFERYQVAVLTA